MLEQVDTRADELGMSRSQYITMVVRKDVMQGGALVIPSTRNSLNDYARKFLNHAIPALKAYEPLRNEKAITQPGDALGRSELWTRFMADLGWILDYKWLESESRDADIGFERAIRHWLHEHPDLWTTPPQS